MEYLISRSSFCVDKAVMNFYEDEIIKIIKDEFVFNSKEFDFFIVVLNYFPEKMMNDLGDDRLQVSRKEKTVFLGVKIYNEIILDQTLSHDEILEYHKKRIIEVKTANLSRLKKIGLL